MVFRIPSDAMVGYRMLQRRREAEAEKAARKYGVAGLAPGGNPELDVLDYAIGEVAGLRRYGEMIDTRAKDWPPDLAHVAHLLSAEMQAISDTMGAAMCDLAQKLRTRGIELGRREEKGGLGKEQ